MLSLNGKATSQENYFYNAVSMKLRKYAYFLANIAEKASSCVNIYDVDFLDGLSKGRQL